MLYYTVPPFHTAFLNHRSKSLFGRKVVQQVLRRLDSPLSHVKDAAELMELSKMLGWVFFRNARVLDFSDIHY